jgi:hypothetical protein
MKSRAHHRGAALCTLALCAACEKPPAEMAIAAPATARATAILEPPRIRIGDRARLEIAVITPPDARTLPFEPPETLPGFEILGSEVLPVQKQASRWIHRSRVSMRARNVGRFIWPAAAVRVVAADGGETQLPIAPLPLEVVSVLPEYPDRMAPFGARSAPPRGGSPGGLPAAAAGSLLTLAALGLVALVRRRKRAAAAKAADAPAAAEPPWTAALAALDRARAGLIADPADAAGATATALCRYMNRRFGADAAAHTTEELAIAPPPFAATSRWPVFVSLLSDLDALRFPAQPATEARSALAARVDTLLRRAEEFVEASTPPEPLR